MCTQRLLTYPRLHLSKVNPGRCQTQINLTFSSALVTFAVDHAVDHAFIVLKGVLEVFLNFYNLSSKHIKKLHAIWIRYTCTHMRIQQTITHTCMQKHTCTHVRTHTCTNTRTCACTAAHCTQSHTHSAHTHASMHARTHGRTHACTYTCTHTCMHVHMHARMYIHPHMHSHTHIRLKLHDITHVHSNTHLNTLLYALHYYKHTFILKTRPVAVNCSLSCANSCIEMRCTLISTCTAERTSALTVSGSSRGKKAVAGNGRGSGCVPRAE